MTCFHFATPPPHPCPVPLASSLSYASPSFKIYRTKSCSVFGGGGSSLKPEVVKTELPCSVFLVCNGAMGSSPFQTTNMQRLSSHGWNNLYWGMFGSQGRIIFQSIPFVSCTAKWKRAPPKNTKGKGLLHDRRQNWHESSPSLVCARSFGTGSSTELLLHLLLNSKSPLQVHLVSYWIMYWFHCVMILQKRVKITSKTGLMH